MEKKSFQNYVSDSAEFVVQVLPVADDVYDGSIVARCYGNIPLLQPLFSFLCATLFAKHDYTLDCCHSQYQQNGQLRRDIERQFNHVNSSLKNINMHQLGLMSTAHNLLTEIIWNTYVYYIPGNLT